MFPKDYDLVGSIHPSLLTLDYSSTKVKVVLVLGSLGVWTVIYLVSAFLASFTWTYKQLRMKEKVRAMYKAHTSKPHT
jgi:hypothetical protein